MANVLLGVTGSVAAIRTPELVAALAEAGHAVRVVATEAACYFFDSAAVPNLYRDADEWPGSRYQRGDPILHIELRRWAALLLIAPLDANTLAKLAMGLCDNCLTCVWRAWDVARPVVLAPAMNTHMWHHPLTARHLASVRELAEAVGQRLLLVGPVEKTLACGDSGIGAMAPVGEIVAAVNSLLPAASGRTRG
jgi:phosphopantothenoylcysteine decarboxylase